MQRFNNNQFNAGGGINIGNHVHGTDSKARDILLANLAPGALHDSGARFDPPRCHPGTRSHILKKIMDWVVGEVGWDGLIKWLNGSAGAGKSAIAQSIAEMCHARQLLLASFFFSRTDPKRNNEKSLIATIAYQITLNAELKTLIINPLTQHSKTGTFQSTPIPNLIIIDGLDECNDHRAQRHILHAISCAVQQSDVPLKFLICSRAEPQLTREFNLLTSKGMATRLSLDDEYKQYDDIKRYLRDSFKEIATTHPLKAYMPSRWPTEDDLSTLVDKSSGQFIFAATVIKYISSDRHQPTRRLETILGMHPSRTATDRPFAELDALYMGIFSFVKREFMFLDPGEVERLLLDLASVVECVDMHTEIRMLHASFPDFLLDRSRSGEYYIDSSTMHAEIVQLLFSQIEVHESEGCATCLGGSYCTTLNYALRHITRHLSKAEPSSDLREALLNTCYITVLIKFESTVTYPISGLLAKFLSFLRRSAFTDTEDLYLHHRNIYDRIMRKRIAYLPVDLGSIVGLVLAGLHPNIATSDFDAYFKHSFPAVEGGLSRLYQTLHFLQGYLPDPEYQILLREFLTDPGRAEVHALDGPKFALAAKFLLDCFITPCSARNVPRLCHINVCSKILSETGILLSKASHSDDLVTRINHADINCQFVTSQRIFCGHSEVSQLEGSLRTLIKEIGDYLTRVVGVAPTHLQIKLWFYRETTSTPLIVGPLYYKDDDDSDDDSMDDDASDDDSMVLYSLDEFN